MPLPAAERRPWSFQEIDNVKVAQRLPTPRRSAWSICFLPKLLVEILDDLPDSGPQLVDTGGEPPSGTGLW